MFKGYKFLAMLVLVVFDLSQAFAETKKFPSGHGVYYVSCAKLAPSAAKEDARPGIDRLEFGFSDTQQYDFDLIVGPVKSDAEEVVLSDAEEAQASGADTHEIFGVSLSRITGVLTITNKSKSKEAKYLCENSPLKTF
jgi:hypothetical protein